MNKNNLKKIILFLTIITILFLFQACKEKECKNDNDCFRIGFKGTCIDYKCAYIPIPNFCGNNICETGENECTCPEDCGPCTGSYKGSKYLQKTCIQDKCLADIPENKKSPISFSREIRNAGDTFSSNIIFKQPFNTKKDLLTIELILKNQDKNNRDEFIKNIEITATTSDRRNIIIARKEINKYLWREGNKIKEEIILDFISPKIEDELTNVEIKINYDYTQKTSTSETEKTSSFKITLPNFKFIYVMPDFIYPCPILCDDNNPATRSYCDERTGFCVHEPIPNMCGNYICETGENKCTCPEDCGPCEGSAGDFLEYKCIENECVAVPIDLKIEKINILDERTISGIKLINNYNYNNPFQVKKDKFELTFNLYEIPEGTTSFTIETVRILSGTDELGKTEQKKIIQKDTKIEVSLKELASLEESKTITLRAWYSYIRNGKTEKGTFTKSLGRITFLDPK
jgi:hypothetical protein